VLSPALVVALTHLVVAAPAGPPTVPEAPVLPAELTLEEAVRVLRERGLDLLVAEAGIEGAQGDVQAAAAIKNPILSGSFGKSRAFSGCTDAQGNPVSCGWLPDPALAVGLSDDGAIFDALSGKRRMRIAVARAALEASRASRDDALRTLTAQVKIQFLQQILAQDALRFAREVAGASARTFELTKVRYEEGAINEADLARIEVAKLESDQSVDQANQSLRDARAQLAFLLGVRSRVPEFAVTAPDLEHFAVPPGLAAPDPDALLAAAREARPDLAAALRQRERTEAALALARRQRFPDVSLSFNYSQQGTTPSATTPPTFTFGVSVPLPLFYRQQGEIRHAEADLASQSITSAKVEAQVATDVESALADWQSAGSLARRMEGGLLERARRARDLVEIQYRKGAASLLELLDAQRTYIATSAEYRQDLAAYWTAVFKLEQAVGRNLR
jgi:cobalt-zinc-cadmium efflux system outer membrane protein